MNFLKIKMVLAIAMMAGAMTTDTAAQYRLPASHTRQHENMLAHQRTVVDEVKKNASKNVVSEIKEREAYQDNDVFTKYWGSQSVNAYAGAVIPETHNIDVTGFVAPLKNCRVSSPYGWRPRFGRMHRGVDLTLNVGDTVSSAFDGKVRLVKYEAKGYGHYVVVRHDNGMETVYGHLSRTLVKPNQRVKAGQAIALGGNTGRSTGPHLHFETRFMGLAVNPEALIDFQHKVTHKDIFTFSKSSYEKSQVYGPRKSAKSVAKASKSKSAKQVASSKKKKSSRKKSRR